MKTAIVALGLAVLTAVPVGAQQQIPVGTRVGEAASGYDDGRRRDPFVSLIRPKTPTLPTTGRPATGLATIAVSDVTVTGIVHSGKSFTAILAGPQAKTFLAHRQDRLQDGVVKSIDAEGVVFVEQLTDVLGAVQQHEIRKLLRPTVEVVR